MRKLLYLLAIILCLNVSVVGIVGCGPEGEPENVPEGYDPSEEEGYGEDMGDGDEDEEEEFDEE